MDYTITFQVGFVVNGKKNVLMYTKRMPYLPDSERVEFTQGTGENMIVARVNFTRINLDTGEVVVVLTDKTPTEGRKVKSVMGAYENNGWIHADWLTIQ